MSQVSVAKGTRDFSPEKMLRRNYIFDTIRQIFHRFGFAPLETPAMENLSTLMGKYGDEGDKLLFKILNSGDFLGKTTPDDLGNSKKLLPKIAEKGLRYDLTVPFARFVAMNRGTLVFPFKRYQIQPVWRADNPQKGRYREFYQCDADIVGTDSLLPEAESMAMIHEVLRNLKIEDFEIKLNHRKILAAMAEGVEAEGKEAVLAVAIDKLDKIGQDKVNQELSEKGFSEKSIEKLQLFFQVKGSNEEKFRALAQLVEGNENGKKGIKELQEILNFVEKLGIESPKIHFEPSLARGLSYYTGAIFEVKVNQVSVGSISGGGRYDNLTGTFGLPDTSGVGFSFGIDRLYDVLEELKLFPLENKSSTQVLFLHFSDTFLTVLSLAQEFRKKGIATEIYPDAVKLKKQMEYANRKNIPFVAIMGENERESQTITLKNMQNGEQFSLSLDKCIEKVILNHIGNE